MALVNVLIMADLFGAKKSVGIILPMLIVCDFTVYPMFRKYATWRQVIPLLVPIVIGIFSGCFFLSMINDMTARKLIGSIVLVMTAIQLIRIYEEKFLQNLPDSKSFLWGTGITIGIATMMANAAGPVYSVYALVHKMSKKQFLGIGARCFLLVNLIKVPFMAGLDMITSGTMKLDVALLPGIFAGIYAGRFFISKIPQRIFEILLYFFSIVAGIRMVFF